MNQATISFINMEKGFGFLTVMGKEKGVFFHATELKNFDFKQLNIGDAVEYDTLQTNEKGTFAKGVYAII